MEINVMIWIWIGVIALAMVVEAFSLDMTSIWFSVGGLCGLLALSLGANITVQVIIFLIVSALCIIFLRNLAKKFIQKPTVPTNIDKNIGQKTKLCEEITEDTMGSLKINGIIYNAKSVDGASIPQNAEVEIVSIEGNKMIVKQCETNNKN